MHCFDLITATAEVTCNSSARVDLIEALDSSAFSASSYYDDTSLPDQSRLSSNSSWFSDRQGDEFNEWIKVRVNKIRLRTGTPPPLAPKNCSIHKFCPELLDQNVVHTQLLT